MKTQKSSLGRLLQATSAMHRQDKEARYLRSLCFNGEQMKVAIRLNSVAQPLFLQPAHVPKDTRDRLVHQMFCDW